MFGRKEGACQPSPISESSQWDLWILKKRWNNATFQHMRRISSFLLSQQFLAASEWFKRMWHLIGLRTDSALAFFYSRGSFFLLLRNCHYFLLLPNHCVHSSPPQVPFTSHRGHHASHISLKQHTCFALRCPFFPFLMVCFPS